MLRYFELDPNKAYVSNNLLLPKSCINETVVKAALNFVLGDEEPVLDEEGIQIDTRQAIMSLWNETAHHLVVPREFLHPAQYHDFRCEFVVLPRPVYQEAGIVDQISLRDDEQAKAFEALLSHDSGTLNLACGKGKTVLALKLAATLNVPTIIVVNTTALLEQWKEEIERHLLVSGIGTVQGLLQDWRHPVVVAMVHTLSNRREQWPMNFRRHFGLALYDECFPAGTLVGNVPIQNLQPGDRVPSYSTNQGQVLVGKVIRVFRKPVSHLIRVQANGKSVICTPNHPFLTKEGWVRAQDLTSRSMVRSIMETYQQEKGTKHEYTPYRNCSLQRMWGLDAEVRESGSGAGEKESSVLLSTMCEDPTFPEKIHKDVSDQSGICVRKNEKEQPDVQGGGAGKSQHHLEGAGLETFNTRREREAPSGCSAASSMRSGVAHRNTSRDTECKAGQKCSGLQAGHRESESKAGNRGGWAFSFLSDPEKSGPKEGENLSWVGVDRVEVLESGSDGTFGGLCPDGFVYNLEVEGTHTYIANSFVVHNCHHMSAPVFVKSADLFYGRRFSLTATATRTDGLETIYQYHLGRVIHSDLEQQLIPHTFFHVLQWDMPVRDKKLVQDKFGEVNTSRVRTYLGRLDWRNGVIYQQLLLDLQAGRKILVLSHSVGHVQALYQYVSAVGAGMIIGETLQGDRMGILRVCNPVIGTFQLAREGLNKPELDTLYVVTPFGNPNDLQQAWGRIQREYPNKRQPIVRVFEDMAFSYCRNSCNSLRAILRDFNYPYERVHTYGEQNARD